MFQNFAIMSALTFRELNWYERDINKMSGYCRLHVCPPQQERKTKRPSGDIRELEHATFLSHGWQMEVNISPARTVVSPRFSN